MSLLRIFEENKPDEYQEFVSFNDIKQQLARVSIAFERWNANRELSLNASQDQILAAYDAPLKKLMQDRGFLTADVISVHAGMPNHPELRQKFIHEHTHSDDEARFFIEGSGIFYIRTNDSVYAVLCERGDFINVPARTRHWFDMGPQPLLKVIRTFKTPEGWVGDFTGSDISSRFPRYESIVPTPA